MDAVEAVEVHTDFHVQTSATVTPVKMKMKLK